MRNGKILKVWIERVVDTEPDASWIGEYSVAATSPAAIDREERGDKERGQYRYFNPANTGEETGNPNSQEEDYQRMESYNRGAWCFLGIIAKAEVQTGRDSPIQTIRSGGLLGVESDGGNAYLNQVEDGEKSELFGELKRMGFSESHIHRAFENIEERDG